MVDLGFLLITFFMYTTTLAKPMVMELQVPRNEHQNTNPRTIPAEATIILLPAANHQVAFYRGTELADEALKWCGFSGNAGLRDLLMSERHRVAVLPQTMSAEAHKLHVLIKPDTGASYADLVRVLDEMQIIAVPSFTMMHPDDAERAAIKKFSVPVYGK